MSFALIDIGSNTIRLSTYATGDEARALIETSPPGELDQVNGFVRVFSKKVMAQLATFTDDDGALTGDGIARATDALVYLTSLASHLGVTDVRAFATASLRDVSNSADALRRIEEGTGLSIELISGDEEARLGFASFIREHPLDTGVICDIGGGSTEVVFFEDGELSQSASLKIGSLKAHKKYVGGLLPTPTEAAYIRQKVGTCLDRAGFDSGTAAVTTVCGIGGSARAVVKLMSQMGLEARTGTAFPTGQLDDVVRTLLADGRRATDLLLRGCPERVHTLIPGALVLQAIAERFRAAEIVIGRYGVREGYVYERII